MSQITVGSLFSGIGGLELGLERAGMRVVWQVEKEEYCRRVLAKHWPDVERFEDVKEVGAHNLKPVDLICGGFPCQDISYAGKGAGLAGARSGLWWEFARIIREMESRYVIVENVPALLTRGLDAVLGTLASLGYDPEWDCVSAESVGAPHKRDRVFLVAHATSNHVARWGFAGPDPRNAERHAPISFGGEVNVAHPESQQGTGQQSAGRDTHRSNGLSRQPRRSGGPERAERHWLIEPNVGRVANGVPRRVDRLRALGNAVVPQVAEYIGRLIVEADEAMRVA